MEDEFLDSTDDSSKEEWSTLMGDDLIMKVVHDDQDAVSECTSCVPDVGDAVRISFDARILGPDDQFAARLKQLPWKETYSEDVDVYMSEKRCLITMGDADVLAAVEMGARFLSEKQTCVVRCHSKFAHGLKGMGITSLSIKEVPSNTCVEFRITIDEIVPFSDFTHDTNIDRAKWKKTLGTELYFLNQEYIRAFKMYKSATEILTILLSEEATSTESDGDVNQTRAKTTKKLLIECHNNITLCYMRQNDFFKAKDSCTTTLEMESGNIKALCRATKCCVELGLYEEAEKVLEAAVEKDSNNADVHKMKQLLSRRRKEYKIKERELYSKMMEKQGKINNLDHESAKEYPSVREKKNQGAQSERKESGVGNVTKDGSLPLQDLELSFKNPRFVALIVALVFGLVCSSYLKAYIEDQFLPKPSS
jgi:tetratricopeptide (TPR) repeat protein